ncbi:UNVERIFIED_CONTAM: hypothetical protein K2H54_039385 [Gekko kuhli]
MCTVALAESRITRALMPSTTPCSSLSHPSLIPRSLFQCSKGRKLFTVSYLSIPKPKQLPEIRSDKTIYEINQPTTKQQKEIKAHRSKTSLSEAALKSDQSSPNSKTPLNSQIASD